MRRLERAVLPHTRWVAAIAAVLALSVLSAAAVAVAAHSATTTTVTTHKGKLGVMLVTSNGHTLYLFTHDSAGKSSCYGACARVWPPFPAHGRLIAAKGSGVNQKLLGTTKRSDGTFQVTYNHHPLYLYSLDKKAGDTHGENVNHFGGHWYEVNTKGNALKPNNGGVVCNPLCQGY